MGKGGARFGAGRPAYRVKAEHLQRIAVGDWARQGYLRGACSFSWGWNRGGVPSGSIGVQVHSADNLTLRYALTQEGVARDVAERITITRTACPYGGARPWFHCPRCARRVAVLYMRQGYFACRHCQRVAYSSQSCGTLDRTWIKQRKIEARMGDDWQRPKGMRQRTYNALLDKLADCEARRDEAFVLVVKRFMGASDFGNGPGQK